MKKNIFFAGILITSLLLSTNSQAQKPEIRTKKPKEIIIRKNGDKNTKTTIEIDGDSITVNGKPLSEYHGDDVSVIQKTLKKGAPIIFYLPLVQICSLRILKMQNLMHCWVS